MTLETQASTTTLDMSPAVAVVETKKQEHQHEVTMIDSLQEDFFAGLAEFFGTWFFIFMALAAAQGAIVLDKLGVGSATVLTIATAFGLALAVSVRCFGL